MVTTPYGYYKVRIKKQKKEQEGGEEEEKHTMVPSRVEGDGDGNGRRL
jgi:hypothetical protein